VIVRPTWLRPGTTTVTLGTWLLRTSGSVDLVREHDRLLLENADDWLVNEIVLYLRRTLKRLDVTSRSLLALIEPGSCFAGSLLELALAADRSYMLAANDGPTITLSAMNDGPLPMSNGLSRFETRFLAGKPEIPRDQPMDGDEALEKGLVTFSPDEIDWEDEVRLAIEERASLSPDALTGMEANLRFAGPETMETKIFGRLSAWQNWIFQRPNAVGEKGALTLYGKPERARFTWTRT